MRTHKFVQAGTVFLALNVACISDYPYAESTGGSEASSSSSSPTTGTTQGSDCGNAMMEPGEDCDDGKSNNGPGKACLADCTMNICGDGDKGPSEGCDDRNVNPTDGCEPNCTPTPAKCGDGFKHADEVCEGESSTCDADCTAAECGDGVVNMLAGETCDDAQGATAMCDDDCTAVECGDGKVNVMAGEACDNGVNIDAPYSMNMPPPDACAKGCKAVEWCGDGIANGSEDCDMGRQTETCESNCASPSCGDGIVNQMAGEFCDDGDKDDGDGCSKDCLEEHRVFVSSILYEGDFSSDSQNPGNLKGILLADARCNDLAKAATLPGSYMAWLSDGTVSPDSRFVHAVTGPYRLGSLNYPIVADNWDDLIDGSLDHAIDADEFGNVPNTAKNVWTNTGTKGTADSASLHCSEWTSNDDTKTTIGKSSALDSSWTKLDTGLCSEPRRIYCFQQ